MAQSICSGKVEYYPVNKKNTCDADSWEIKERIGEESAYGELWKACCDKRCAFVMKFQKYGYPERSEFMEEYEPVTQQTLMNEIDMQNSVAKLGLAIPVVNSWFCDKGGVIIMRSLKATVREILKTYSNPEVIGTIIVKCLGMIERLHLSGFVHGDTHLNNFMVTYREDDATEAEDEEDEMEKYKIYDYNFFFIDFGRSSVLESGKNKNEQILEDYYKFTTDIQNIYDNEKNDKRKSTYEKIINYLIVYVKEIQRSNAV